MFLDVIARADERTHPAPSRQSSLQRLEPVCIRIPGFVMCGAERLQRTDDEVVHLAVIIVLQEGQEIEEQLPCRQMRRIQSGRYLRQYCRVV